jgi:hypothetical protein
MFYQQELSFLCDVFKNNHIGAHVINLSELKNSFLEDSQTEYFERQPVFHEMLSSISPRTVYRLTDSFEFCYRILLLPDTDTETLFYIGPFLAAPISKERILEIG